MIDNGKSIINKGEVMRFCYVTVGGGSSLVLRSVTEEVGKDLENSKIGVTSGEWPHINNCKSELKMYFYHIALVIE